jgi:hypothetical protein
MKPSFRQRVASAAYTIICIASFAFVGVLLAWRG